MNETMDRREFIRLAALGGIVFASGISATAYGVDKTTEKPAAVEDFYFVQLSDTHWGFDGPPNPDSHGTLPKAIEAINALKHPPDFVVFTGDLTHLNLDGKIRRARMAEFRDVVAKLNVRDLRFLPGEHDASLDRGEAYQEYFGPTHYSFDHKGLHFIVLDNVSDPKGILGEDQLAWLAADLAMQSKNRSIVIMTHRPLFDLQPEWGWATGDGARAIEMLMPFPKVTVFYGHIHQENQHATGHIIHYAARSLIFPLPPPGSPDHKPIPWDPTQPYRGLGWRGIEAATKKSAYEIHEYSIPGS